MESITTSPIDFSLHISFAISSTSSGGRRLGKDKLVGGQINSYRLHVFWINSVFRVKILPLFLFSALLFKWKAILVLPEENLQASTTRPFGPSTTKYFVQQIRTGMNKLNVLSFARYSILAKTIFSFLK